MDKKALDILADAVSDVGSWQWWHMEKDMLQLEFRDVRLYDASKPEKDAHTMDVTAVRFYGNVFAVFLDDLEEEGKRPWYERFYDDEITAFACSGYVMKFDSPEFAQEVIHSYRNRTPVTPFEGRDTLTGAKHLIAARCHDVGIAAGGDRIRIVSRNGPIEEEKIESLSEKWWKYRKNYWKMRETKDAFKKDWAREVTIPAGSPDRQGE